MMILQLRVEKVLEHSVGTSLQTLLLNKLVDLAVNKKEERFAPKRFPPFDVALQPEGKRLRKIDSFERCLLPRRNRSFQ